MVVSTYNFSYKRPRYKKSYNQHKITYRVDSNGYDMNFKSKGMSGSVLQYLTLQISSDLKPKITSFAVVHCVIFLPSLSRFCRWPFLNLWNTTVLNRRCHRNETSSYERPT